jgi:hypothetical protein
MFNNDLSDDQYDAFRIEIESSETYIKKFKKNNHIYYAIPHNSPYKVKMINNMDLRTNAVLRIDGEVMGKWRIGPYSEILVERPSHNDRKFIFVEESSGAGIMGGVATSNIKVDISLYFYTYFQFFT